MAIFRDIADWPKAEPPSRIISLVPSITETLFDLGLMDKIIGVTKFCVHPANGFTNMVKIGGTKNIKIDLIRQLKPDLVIANLEENVAEQVKELAGFTRVWLTDIVTLEDGFDLIEKAGQLTGTAGRGIQIAADIRRQFSKVHPLFKPLKCAYLIWQKPYMAAGNDTFIHHMLNYLGFINIFGGMPRYPAVDLEELKQLQPDLILLSSEPYPFRQKHAEELAVILPGAAIKLVDGEMFSWYGTRLLYAPAYFNQLLSSLKQFH